MQKILHVTPLMTETELLSSRQDSNKSSHHSTDVLPHLNNIHIGLIMSHAGTELKQFDVNREVWNCKTKVTHVIQG